MQGMPASACTQRWNSEAEVSAEAVHVWTILHGGAKVRSIEEALQDAVRSQVDPCCLLSAGCVQKLVLASDTGPSAPAIL